MNSFAALLPHLKRGRPVYLQTHNFPDHDAVAAAFGLGVLLEAEGFTVRLAYDGIIQRDSLAELVAALRVPIRPAADWPIAAGDDIVIVDGCKNNKNVTDLSGREVGIIDHHETTAPDDVAFVDIRPDYGACSTIVHGYFIETGRVPPAAVATALFCGLATDTALMTRGVSEADLAAYTALYPAADIAFVNANLRNSIQEKDLVFFRQALEQVRVRDRLAFCCLHEGCNQNLLGILGDFFLALREVDMVFLCARNETQINFSLRSEVKRWNAAAVVREVLAGIGFGGGHADMAGGIVQDARLFDPEAVYEKLRRVLKLG